MNSRQGHFDRRPSFRVIANSLLCTSAILWIYPSTAFAQSSVTSAPATSKPSSADGDNGLSEIIVTAQRRSERLQDVPIAVNVVSGDALTQRGISGTQALSAVVPGLAITENGAAGTIYLRGVGSNDGNPNAEPSVATYVDGVYIASPMANILELNSIERVEVLKGPQGTLFGRNATGGVIQIITRDPSHTPALEGVFRRATGVHLTR